METDAQLAAPGKKYAVARVARRQHAVELVDALRWVLCEQNLRTLRARSMLDLIFAGSATRHPVNYAEAEVVFNNEGDVFRTGSDMVSIARRVFRSRESNFLIDGNDVQLRDVEDLLTSTGLGFRHYPFIGQGEMSRVFTMKPEERKATHAFDTDYKEGVFAGYRWFDDQKIEPWFPFGHGLSYTTFELSSPKVTEESSGIRIACTVKNTGSRPGAEVVQVYVAPPKSSVRRPLRELKGFARVLLQPGESRRVEITLRPSALAYYDEMLSAAVPS